MPCTTDPARPSQIHGTQPSSYELRSIGAVRLRIVSGGSAPSPPTRCASSQYSDRAQPDPWRSTMNVAASVISQAARRVRHGADTFDRFHRRRESVVWRAVNFRSCFRANGLQSLPPGLATATAPWYARFKWGPETPLSMNILCAHRAGDPSERGGHFDATFGHTW